MTSVKWVDDHWALTYTKTDTKTNHTEQCDFVAVASGGEFTAPVWPKFEGQETFKGMPSWQQSFCYKDFRKY